MEYVTLNNGLRMPNLGFGVYLVTDYEECKKSVLEALKNGYLFNNEIMATGLPL